MKNERLLGLDLTLFDGGGEGAGGAAAPAAPGPVGDTKALPGSTRRGNQAGALQGVVYGKGVAAAAPAVAAAQSRPSDAGREQRGEDGGAPATPEERRRAFRDLVSGEYKDLYSQEVQRIIDRRFRETKTLERQLSQSQPVIDLLLQRYQIEDGDMGRLAAALAGDGAPGEAGPAAEPQQLQRLRQENAQLLQAQRQQRTHQAAQAQLRAWHTQAGEVQTAYPGFNLEREARNPQFLSLLKAGVPVGHAYEVLHMADIKAGVAQKTQKQVVDGIRAKGVRPQENGTSTQSAFTVRDEVSNLSRRDRAEIARRVARGEKIHF